MPTLNRLMLLLAFGTGIACSSPAERPEELAPNVVPLSKDKDHEPRVPSSANPFGPDVQASGALEEIAPGTFSTRNLPPRFTIITPIEVPFKDIDRDIGRHIRSMYKTVEEQGWKKEGPALVAVRGSLEGPTVSAEITFVLNAAPSNAEELGLTNGTLPGGLAVVGMHKGARATLAETNKELDAWCAAENKKPRGDLRWFVFLNRPDQVTTADLLTAVVQPVE